MRQRPFLALRCRSATDQNSEDFSVRAAVLRFGMPCRCVKDCRVGRTRPPRNDKIGRFCGKTGWFANSRVWNFLQGDISVVTLLGRYIIRPTGRISYAQHILYSYELYSITASAVLRFGMPCRYVKDCRVGRTRPPRNDKNGRICGKTGGFANSKVGAAQKNREPTRFPVFLLILESVKKLEELFIAPTARQILHETAQRACAQCECS